MDADKAPVHFLSYRLLIPADLDNPTEETTLAPLVSLAVDGEGNVYALDRQEHRIMVYDSTGRFLRQIGRPGQGPGELLYPASLDIDEEGFIYVVNVGNRRVEIYRPGGEYHASFTPEPFSARSFEPIAAAGGEVYLSLPESGFLVTVFSRAGDKLREFGELVPYEDPFHRRTFNEPIMRIDRHTRVLHVLLLDLPIYRRYSTDGTCLLSKRIDSALIRRKLDIGRKAMRRAKPGQILWARIFLSAVVMPDHSLIASLKDPENDVSYRFSPDGAISTRYFLREGQEVSLDMLAIRGDGRIVTGDVYRGSIGLLVEERR